MESRSKEVLRCKEGYVEVEGKFYDLMNKL